MKWTLLQCEWEWSSDKTVSLVTLLSARIFHYLSDNRLGLTLLISPCCRRSEKSFVSFIDEWCLPVHFLLVLSFFSIWIYLLLTSLFYITNAKSAYTCKSSFSTISVAVNASTVNSGVWKSYSCLIYPQVPHFHGNRLEVLKFLGIEGSKLAWTQSVIAGIGYIGDLGLWDFCNGFSGFSA